MTKEEKKSERIEQKKADKALEYLIKIATIKGALLSNEIIIKPLNVPDGTSKLNKL